VGWPKFGPGTVVGFDCLVFCLSLTPLGARHLLGEHRCGPRPSLCPGGKGPAGPKTRPPMQEGWAAVVMVPERSPAAVGSSSKYTPNAAWADNPSTGGGG